MKNETERLEALRVKIIQWADEKGILAKATPEKQFLKFMEETGELAKAILTSDSEEFIDAVGDVFVTIVIHAKLRHHPFHYLPSLDWTGGDIAESISAMSMNVDTEEYKLALEDLYLIYCENYDLAKCTFTDCVEVAYNVIAGRTGEMINGSFVKDE